jgi:hypothetical protein
MVSLANGPAASAGLLGGEPAVNGAPAFLETPVEPEPTPFPAPLPAPTVPPAAEARRLVVRLLGGEELELGVFDDRDDAVEAAQELASRFARAEADGEWPEVDGRFLRPGAIASVDVLVRG